MNNIIPMPKSVNICEGFLCIKSTYTVDFEGFKPCLHAFSDIADRLWGLTISALDTPMVADAFMTPLTEAQKKDEKKEPAPIVGLTGEERCDTGFYIKKDATLASGEYKIITDKACVIYAADTEGVACALATVLQMAQRTCDKYIKLPKGTVCDRPDSSWRSLMLDVARKWHPVDYLFRYVDLCFLLKINRFIIHFTDDESFTLPLDSFPLLATENRSYSKSELRALSEYAASRGVMIVPEVDMPGHCAQFLLKYPDVFGSCGILEASEDTFSALEKIYREVSELFCESEYIHIGGDEAVLGRWEDSEKSKSYMADKGIPDLVQLYGHYIGRISDFILSIGKTPVVWEGFRKESNDKVSKSVLVIAWESHYQLAQGLIDDGFTVINASWKPLYVVSPWQKWSPNEILSWDKFTWDHWWEGSEAYKNKIIVDKKAPVIGAILCAWGDYLKGYESCRLACELELKCVMPRLSALSEKVWNENGLHTDESFDTAYRKLYEKISLIFGQNPFRGEL